MVDVARLGKMEFEEIETTLNGRFMVETAIECKRYGAANNVNY